MAAMAAFTFSSCEDVPEPYTMPEKPETPGTGDAGTPEGTGTATDPFNIAGAIKYIEDGGSSTAEMYVKGKVVSVNAGSYDANYGSLKYYISDDGTSNNQFYVYNGYAGPNRTKFTGEDALKAGDEVVICGQLIEYSGTKEFQTGNYIVTLNGNPIGGGTPDTPTTGKGSESDPYNVAEAIAVIKAGKAPTTEVYLSGIISDVAFYNEQYKSITYYISDDGKSKDMQVYSGKGLNGKDFASKEELKVGQKVTILGKIMKFTDKNGNEIMEVDKTSSIIKIEDGGSTTPDTPSVNDGTEAKPFSVTEVIAKGFDPVTKGVYIKAYIIGSAPGKDFTTLTFTTEGASGTNIGIAANATESNASNCIPVQLPKGDVRAGVNLSTNPGNFKQEIILYGDIDKYFGMVGIKNVTYAKIGDKIYGKKP